MILHMRCRRRRVILYMRRRCRPVLWPVRGNMSSSHFPVAAVRLAPSSMMLLCCCQEAEAQQTTDKNYW